jgi:hypothetical protein
MHGLAVVAQSLLRETFRITYGLCAFRPSVAVTVQCHADNAKLAATRRKFRGAVAGPHAGQIRKQRAFAGQVFEQIQRLAAQMHQHRHAGFLPGTLGSYGVVNQVSVLVSVANPTSP